MLRVLVLLLVLSPVLGCSTPRAASPPEQEPVAAPAPAPAPARWLTPIADASQVCMINDQFMGRAQIAVPVDGKTYWGCCEGCKLRLSTDPATRIANDPVTGEVVDKATAVMAHDDFGAVYYFASTENMRRYRL